MRMFALAAVAALGVATVADARVWTDPAGRVTFDAPNNWATTVERGAAPTDTFTYVISGSANNECHFISQPNPNLANSTAYSVKLTAADPATITPELWAQTANGMAHLFPNSSAQVLSTSVETDAFWPIQRAEIQAPERLVHAALQLRPGLNLITMCMTYAGADPTAARALGDTSKAMLEARFFVKTYVKSAVPAEGAPRAN